MGEAGPGHADRPKGRRRLEMVTFSSAGAVQQREESAEKWADTIRREKEQDRRECEEEREREEERR